MSHKPGDNSARGASDNYARSSLLSDTNYTRGSLHSADNYVRGSLHSENYARGTASDNNTRGSTSDNYARGSTSDNYARGSITDNNYVRGSTRGSLHSADNYARLHYAPFQTSDVVRFAR